MRRSRSRISFGSRLMSAIDSLASAGRGSGRSLRSTFEPSMRKATPSDVERSAETISSGSLEAERWETTEAPSEVRTSASNWALSLLNSSVSDACRRIGRLCQRDNFGHLRLNLEILKRAALNVNEFWSGGRLLPFAVSLRSLRLCVRSLCLNSAEPPHAKNAKNAKKRRGATRASSDNFV